jgi:hypothetical protein
VKEKKRRGEEVGEKRKKNGRYNGDIQVQDWTRVTSDDE